jgi:hypothetical protein
LPAAMGEDTTLTQTITLIADHGIWQSSDMRISIDGVTKDDYSIKHVIVNCPDGVALLSYAGEGRFRVAGQYVHTSDWIRQILRGQGRGLDETFIYLRERATEDLGELLFKKKIAHMFTVGALLNGTPWVLQIRNFPVSRESRAGPIEPKFQTSVMKIPSSALIITHWPPLRPPEMTRLARLSGNRPRRWKQIANLLAAVNLQVAKRNRLVSPHCVVTYVPNRKDLNGVKTEIHNAPRSRPPISPAFVFRGIDMTDSLRLLQLVPVDSTKSEEAARNSVIARNPLRPKRAS